MGWTHFWQREISLPGDKFKNAMADCRRIISASQVNLSGEDGTGDPVFTEDEIIFNGTSGMNCEPFIIKSYELSRRSPAKTFSHCKTEHLPYDICVQCVLITLKHHLGNLIAVSSDGKERDWQKAKELCQKILGYGKEFKFEDFTD
ncbi:MAG: hypothetical protein GY774_41280 [Planctomycetes bacterium]|nr:hypothetical protein [Planctomycetota bacterium]